MKILTLRQPILPRSKADPTLQGKRVKRLWEEIDIRYDALSLAIVAEFKKMASFRAANTEIIPEIVPEYIPEWDIQYDLAYDFQPEEYARFQEKVRLMMEEWIKEEPSGSLWMENYIEAAARDSTLTSQASLAQQSETYAAERQLSDIINSQPYQDRLAIAYQLAKAEWDHFNSRVMQTISESLMDSIGQGLSVQKTAKNLQKALGIEKNYAKKIAQTELLAIYRKSAWEEAKQARDLLGLDIKILHVSALKPTTRLTHAARHGQLYDPEQEELWYQQGGNKYNCYCSSVPVVANYLPASTLKNYAEERKGWVSALRKKND